jgi:predicted enzyme related to lactoylglutathione lyase
VYLWGVLGSLLGMRASRVDARWVARDASFISGSVCWVDVSSTDPVGSREFYSGLFGWTYQIDAYPGRGHYLTALCGGGPVAGLSGVAVQAGHPAAWTLYLASADVMRAAQVFGRWGGRVLLGPTDVAGQGRVLIGVDPTGAVIGFWQPARPWMFRRVGPGSLYWAELDTWDGARADAFFADLFGYQQRQIGDGIEVDYTTWARDGKTMLGRLGMHDGWANPDCAAHWMLHFAVDPQVGTDAAAHRVVALGGRVDIDPYDTELGRIARVTDPSGAAFALIDPTDRVDAATDLAAGSARVDDPYDD